MRLLVLDGSRVLQWMVSRLAPEGVEVVGTSSFDRAVEAVRSGTVDAVIADVAPTDLPWWQFHDACCHHEPQIPMLFESCVAQSLEDLAVGEACSCIDFLAKPYSSEDLRAHLERLLRAAGASPSAPAKAPTNRPR